MTQRILVVYIHKCIQTTVIFKVLRCSAPHISSVYIIFTWVCDGGGGSAAHDLNITNKLFGRIFFYVCEVVRRVVVVSAVFLFALGCGFCNAQRKWIRVGKSIWYYACLCITVTKWTYIICSKWLYEKRIAAGSSDRPASKGTGRYDTLNLFE